MLFQKKRFAQTWLFLFILFTLCACTLGRIAPEQPSRVYSKSYDEVWEAVTGVVLDDLGCAEKKLRKNKGYLETEWVSTFDTTGQHRWKIEAYLKQHKSTVRLQLDKIVQNKDDVSKTISKYSKTTEKKDEPVGPHAGWSDAAATEQEIENLYHKIDLRLGEQKQ